MDNNNLMPEIRFKGFTDAWVQRKLGEVTTKIGSGKTPRGGNSVYLEEGVPLLRSQNVANNTVDLTDVVFISEATDEEMANSRVKHQDVLLNITGASIGRSAVYEHTGNANVNQHVCIIRPSTGANPCFIQLNLTSANGQQQIDNNQAGGGREGINFQQIAKITFAFPSEAEQTAIGTFFRTLDKAITLNQRKLEGLRELKKGYFQLMFPQTDERAPRVRFAGFGGEWQTRRLCDIAEFNPRLVLPDLFEYVDLESVIGTTLLSHRTERKDTAPSRAQRLAKKGDVFFQTVRPYQQNNYLFELDFDNFVFSTGYAQLRPNIDSYFLLCILQEEKFVLKVLDNCTGTSYPAINSTDLAGIGIVIPVDFAEQIILGRFFRTLDNQITSLTQKAERLKALKLAYLQKMFV